MDKDYTMRIQMKSPQEPGTVLPVADAALRYLDYAAMIEDCGFVDGVANETGRELHPNENSVKTRALCVLDKYFRLALEGDGEHGNE